MNAPPFNANPIIPVVIGSVLTICLRVSIYAHIWGYLSVYVHFMSIYGDLCRTRFDHLFACVHLYCPFILSVCIHFMPIYGDLCICLSESALAPIYGDICLYMPIYGDLCICPYAHIWSSQSYAHMEISVSAHMPIYGVAVMSQ